MACAWKSRWKTSITVHLYIWGTATPKRNGYTNGYSYTYEVQLYLWGTVTLKRYSYTYNVQLLLGGIATPMKTATFKSTLKNIFRRLLNYLQFSLYNNENQGCRTGKFEDGSGSDILFEYVSGSGSGSGSGSSSGSGSYTCIYIYIYVYVYVYIFVNVYLCIY
jgi:hypothetical protein